MFLFSSSDLTVSKIIKSIGKNLCPFQEKFRNVAVFEVLHIYFERQCKMFCIIKYNCSKISLVSENTNTMLYIRNTLNSNMKFLS